MNEWVRDPTEGKIEKSSTAAKTKAGGDDGGEWEN